MQFRTVCILSNICRSFGQLSIGSFLWNTVCTKCPALAEVCGLLSGPVFINFLFDSVCYTSISGAVDSIKVQSTSESTWSVGSNQQRRIAAKTKLHRMDSRHQKRMKVIGHLIRLHPQTSAKSFKKIKGKNNKKPKEDEKRHGWGMYKQNLIWILD